MNKIFRHLMVMMGVGLWFIWGGSSHSQNLPPVIDPVGPCYVNEGDTLTINLHATDPDGDILKIRVLNSPPNALFSYEETGDANFRWVPEFIGPHSSSGSPFELFFVASDGGLSTRIKVKVNVINVNRPPELILPDSSTIGATMELIFQVRAEDPDKEEVRISAVDLPPGASFDEEGMFSWIPALADTGGHMVLFEAVDLSGGNELKEAHIRVVPPSPYVLSIGIEEALVGGTVKIPINLSNPDQVSGMELLIQYDPSVYTFLNLTKEGTRASEWEYYVYRERTWGLFQLIKIVGIADFPNEFSALPLSSGDGSIAYLNFKMTSNTQLAGLLIPLEFYNFDFTDNTLSTPSGEFISRDKINFNDGGVFLKSGNTLLGDINLNGIPFEVGDAVRLALFLTFGASLDQQQLLNSDVNQDGYWGTLADLIYLLTRIQEEGSAPYVEPDPEIEMAKIVISDQPTMTSFSANSQIGLGGVWAVFKGTNLDSQDVRLSSEVQDMDLYTHKSGDEFRVMIISTAGKYISPGNIGIKEADAVQL
ncbi:MAG: cohesin domain-containing protein, partial [Candidatus Zixiibacteriota bacterium]